MNKIFKTYKYLLALAVFTSCSDITNIFENSPVEFEEGEKVMFTTNVPNVANVVTRAYTPDTELLRGYSTINDNYELSIKMFEDGVQDALGKYIYCPVSDETGYNVYGKLAASDESQSFYWNSNVRKYAFEATAGTEVLEVDQSTKEKWLAQDRLHGYAFAPLLDNEKNNASVDNINALNYHTNKEWGAMNKAWRDAASAENEMLSAEDYKMIPLFLQHQRAWITLKLKAGNGVSRDDLKFENAQKKVSVSFFNYANGAGEPMVIDKPFLVKDKVDYSADKMGGEEKDAETTSFNVIVDPHDYTGENAAKDKIAAISVAGLKFSFFAANDDKYTTSAEPTDEERLAMAAYNLKAGKHLTITATLTTDRIVYITAWIEDWTEIATSTICDDYGQNGDPILINSRADLISFLDGPDNKSGNVAIVVANTLDLDKNITTTYYQEGDTDIPAGKKPGDVRNSTETPDPWSSYTGKTLRATLNMAGAKFTTSSQFLGTIESTGSIVNGTVVMNNTTPVNSAIAETNSGTLERISIIPYGTAKASKGGLVVTNHGTIYQCTTTLPVYGTENYLGGIAAESTSIDGTLMPVIDGCTVNAPVKGTEGITAAGGIVGHADGRITNNVNEYGITLLQSNKYKNIIGAQANNTLRASNNSWPTIAKNRFDGEGANENANTTAQYDNVIDCQEELREMLKSPHNQSDKRYRIAADFTVNSQDWKRSSTDLTYIGQKHDDITTHDDICSNGNLYCELNGNNKTITLDGTEKVKIPTAEAGGKATAYEEKTTSAMLFSNITGSVHDLTIYIATPLIATPSVKDPDDRVLTSIDAIAPLAYSVRGETAIVSNIKVKMKEDAYVQAALTAGLVCWVSHGATVENCQVKGKIQSWLPNAYHGSTTTDGSDARRYTGGIVGEASKATIKSCIFHSTTNTLIEAKSTPSETNIYFGGILGCTAVKDINNVKELPAVSIVDCISWYETSETTRAVSTVKKGTIIGRAQYSDNNVMHNGTVTTGDDRCQGNWWKTAYDAVGERLPGETDETVVGKCSGATPTIDNKY